MDERAPEAGLHETRHDRDRKAVRNLRSLLTVAVITAAMSACGGGSGDTNDQTGTSGPTAEPTPSREATPAAESPPDLESIDLQGVAVAPDGTVFAADAGGSVVLRINKGGKITTFAGEAGFHGLKGDGGPVSEALLRGPTGLAVDPAGNLYITDHGNHRVRKIDANGTITTVVGSGPEGSASGGFSGDGGQATKARLQEPVAVAVDRANRILIADRDNYRVRAVDADGTITTLAGDGSTGPKRIDGPATKAALGLPVGVAAGSHGSVYVADEGAHRVYKIDADGTMTAFAGTGKAGYAGDGGFATEAELNVPYGLATDRRGNVYIADHENHAIRVVNRRGTIRTLAGTGREGSSGDRGPATKARLSGPYAVAVNDSGTIYIADKGNGKVRRVDRSGTITTKLP
jgi:sugar lactone lactonase YvrE